MIMDKGELARFFLAGRQSRYYLVDGKMKQHVYANGVSSVAVTRKACDGWAREGSPERMSETSPFLAQLASRFIRVSDRGIRSVDEEISTYRSRSTVHGVILGPYPSTARNNSHALSGQSGQPKIISL